MLVKNWMNHEPITVSPKDTILFASELMKKNGIKMMPVIKGGVIVGVVTDRDLKHASASDANALEVHELLYLLARVTIGEIMSKPAVTVPYDFTLEETAELLLKNGISSVPVVDHTDHLVGTIAKEDIFSALIALTGLHKRGIQFAVTVKNKPGSIKEVADIIRMHAGRVVSILSTNEDLAEQTRTVYFRTYGIDRNELPKIKEGIEQYGRLHYLVDLRDNKREIFD